MASTRIPKFQYLDCLYGPVTLSEEISLLIRAPIVQRLRHIRLSNIDSVGLPGISGLSRFEHVLGTAHLAAIAELNTALSSRERVALQASALLHDWAITAYGHLVEEAFAYVGSSFNHESKLYELIHQPASADVGGINRQVLCGRETGLLDWCRDVFGVEAEECLDLIVSGIRGKGRFGHLISGDIDLDNIDNLHRIAFHMGLAIDKDAPLQLARSIRGVSISGLAVFARSALEGLENWVDLRRRVYTRLMLTQPDFTTKLMLIYAAVCAIKANELTDKDWNLTDYGFVERLLSSKVKDAKETAERWMTGEFWETAPLMWLEGKVPNYEMIGQFADSLTNELGRRCYAYRIKDKRERLLEVATDDGMTHTLGRSSDLWLLGIGSPMRKQFTGADSVKLGRYAEEFFGAKLVKPTSDEFRPGHRQESLI